MKFYLTTLIFLLASCGKPETSQLDFSYQPSVISGQLVSPYTDEGDYVVSLGSCTGIILAKDLILTAAHCTAVFKFYAPINFGLDRDNPLHTRRVDSYWVNSSTNAKQDLAIIKFYGGLPNSYKPVKLMDSERLKGVDLKKATLTVMVSIRRSGK